MTKSKLFQETEIQIIRRLKNSQLLFESSNLKIIFIPKILIKDHGNNIFVNPYAYCIIWLSMHRNSSHSFSFCSIIQFFFDNIAFFYLIYHTCRNNTILLWIHNKLNLVLDKVNSLTRVQYKKSWEIMHNARITFLLNLSFTEQFC